MKIKISNKWVGEKHPAFVIAEAGINHNGDLKIAKKLITEAKKANADSIKFQTFQASDLASKKSKYYNLFKKLEFSDAEFTELSHYAKSKDIIFLSTPFSLKAVDLLAKLRVPAFKIASGDLTNLPLIKYAASKNKPMIISTGMANMKEINEAIKTIQNTKNNKIIVMHSVSGYPTPIDQVNLNIIKSMAEKIHYPIGYSDNGSDNLVPIVAVVLGAKIIEKHFTLNKKMNGPDHSMSCDPKELREIIINMRSAEKMLGTDEKSCQPSELINKTMARRSIITLNDIPKNTIIDKNMVGIKRPATGIAPKFIDKIIGKKTKQKIKAETPLRWSDIK
ncbi:MAG: N-acetylneuraminate synthase family protein [Nitrosarchaeum sp.]|nr:N-acetylneuraminate synthase family protein [Nitrosarchaeum sp.]